VDKYFDIISGRNREWTADLLRLGLNVCALPYLGITEARHWGFNHGYLRTESVSVPVISVGNLTTGGTGKTPTVAWLVNRLIELGRRPAIVSRGYRSLDGEANDEKRLLDDLCPGVPHLQHSHRATAAKRVLQTTSANLIVLDDGFQHRRFHRDLDLVLIDALNPWGFNALLPRGLLRERLRHLARADVVLVTRCDLVPEEQIRGILQRIRRFTDVPVLRTCFQAQQFVNSNGETLPLEQAAERAAFAFCGIGNPDGFQQMLTQLGMNHSAEHLLRFPDHYHYTQIEMERIPFEAERQQAELLFTTRKDLVKIRRTHLGNLPVWALDIALTFVDDSDLLTGMFRTLN